MVPGTSFRFDGQGTETAVDAMKRYCGLLDEQEMEGKSPAQWPATKELVGDHGEMVFEDDISQFCPKRAKILKSAVASTCPRLFQEPQTGSRPRRARLRPYEDLEDPARLPFERRRCPPRDARRCPPAQPRSHGMPDAPAACGS
ncbi:hypothetical protein Snoj_36370 [Streptomyces nojiriensis]|uniref:Uncharacterized protein n=1 Tax=Streptomyces nojiriensis TaxID=66374 RepID=A0ABQ3SNK3_9ACTN|nr:hypothetical protein GCM10010205_46740 [Streptomyces nojiriensis]GHI69719.1 hypothetical protein Snoj_36370 [Streptomyces nojiriensis]